MAGLDGGQMLEMIKQKAEQLKLKPGSEVVIKLTQKELGKHLKGQLKDGSFYEYDPKAKKVIIYKPKKKNYKCAEKAFKEEGISVQDVVDICSDEINQKWVTVDGLDKYLSWKEKELAQKEKEVKELERLALMNPSREFILFARNFDKYWGKVEYDLIISKLEKVKKAISHFPVEKKYYEIGMPVYNKALEQINAKINTVSDSKEKEKLEKIKELLEFIIKHTKAKNIGLA